MSRPRTAVGDLLNRAVQAGVAPSAIALWGRPGEPLNREMAGHAQLRPTPRPPASDTWYDLASLTKPLVVGTLTLLAVREGRLQLETTIGEIFNTSTTDAPVAAATVGQLLSHWSGLPAWRPLYALGTDPKLVVQSVLGIELSAAPGDRVVYSCLGFIMLGKALEKIYGAPLQNIFADRVLRPFKLEDGLGFNVDPLMRTVAGGSVTAEPELRMTAEMGYPPSSVPPVGSATPHDGNARFLGGAAGNSGLFGTAEGVFRLASEYVEGAGSLLTASEIEAATTPVAADLHQVRGLAWQLGMTPECSAGRRFGPSAFGHVGFTGTSVWVDPTLGSVFVLLTNRCHADFRDVDLHPLRRRFHALAVRDLVSRTAN